MTTTTERRGSKHDPRTPQIPPDTVAHLAETEYVRVADMLERLEPAEWRNRTDCTEWDVRAMAGHMLGMMQMVSSWPELARQQLTAERRAKRDGVESIDALTALQVDKNAGLSTEELVAQIRRLTPRAVRARRRAPGLMRKMTTEQDGEYWTVGYLFDIILTRDPFMHRIDISRATDVPMEATSQHEGAIIADVVEEWADRHGRAYELDLSGPAGGHWHRGASDGEHIAMDAFDFCRVLSGRAPAEGLLRTQVPF